MRNIFAVFGIFTWSFANTTNMMVSNIIGQGRQDEVLFLIRKIAKLSFFTILVLGVLLNLFPGAFLSIYGADSSFVAEAIPVVRIITAGLLIMSAAVVWLNSITGTGNTRVNLKIEITTIVIYTIYIYLVVDRLQLPLVYAWASEILYWLVTFALAWTYMRRSKWKSKDIWK